jgi:hypothetical protein
MVAAPQTWIRTDESSYAAAESVTVFVTNISDAALSHGGGFCPKTLERWATDAWSTAVSQPDSGRVCTGDLISVAPGATDAVTLAVPAALAPGVYRLRFDDLWGGDDELLPLDQRVSNGFEIH